MKMSKFLAVFAAAGVFSAALALAADPPAQPAPANPAGQGGRGARGMAGGGMGGGIMLDDQQRQLYREAIQKDGEKLRALDEKLRAAQKQLVDATLTSTYDEKVVRDKAEALAKIQVEITVLRAKALSTVAPAMKPEQKQQIAESRFVIMMLTGGGFDTMDRGGGPGGQGGQGGRGNRGGGGGGGQGPGR